jgi:vacuolar-type H+-ATPase subunit F/Vma7
MAEDRKNIAVIRTEEFTVGFRLARIQKTFNTENYEEKRRGLLQRDDIGILVADENDLEKLSKRTMNRVEESVEPVVVTLSEKPESERLREKIRKAIGADIG